MGIRKSGNFSIQGDRSIPALPQPESDGTSSQPSLVVANRVSLIDLLVQLPHLRDMMLSAIGGKGDPDGMGARIQRFVCKFNLVCRQGKELFKDLSFLSKDHKLGLAEFRRSGIAKWHSAQQALLNEQTLALALDGSPVVDLRGWKWELVSLFLGKTHQKFTCEKLCIDTRKVLGTSDTFLSDADWELLVDFLRRHAALADRPVVHFSVGHHLASSPKLAELANALVNYGKEKGAFELSLLAQTNSGMVLYRLSEVASSGLLRNLCLDLGSEVSTDFLQRIAISLSKCSALESLKLRMECCEQLPEILKNASQNENLKELMLNLDDGDVKHLANLPELLKSFPKLSSLRLLVQWAAPKEELLALKKALMDQYPNLQLEIYWRDLWQSPVLI